MFPFKSAFMGLIVLGMSIQCLAAPLTMGQVYGYASKGNINALKSLGSNIDGTDKNGNTALCIAVLRNDYSSFYSLKSAGANVQHQCVQRIPQQQIQNFRAGYANWMRTSYVAGSTQTPVSETETGLGTKALVGIGAVALIGGGVALAAGGGGGGGGSSKSSDSNTCTGHSTKNAQGKCVCDNGWTGASCNTPATCAYTTVSCRTGYSETGNTCKSGDNVYKECAPTNCSAYQTRCAAGYDATQACLSGTTPYYTCTPKEVPNGYQQDCGQGYDATDIFRSGETDYYKCEPVNCSAYKLSCEDGYNAVQACLSGETPYYTCVPKNIPAGYRPTLCTIGYDTTDTIVVAGTNYYKCEPKQAPDGYTTTDCATGYERDGEPFVSGETTYYKCKEQACSGYTLSACPANATRCDSCSKGQTITYKVTQCNEGWEGTSCDTAVTCPYTTTSCTGDYVETGVTCKSGDTLYKQCDNYPFDTEPENCALIKSRETENGTKYMCAKCNEGYGRDASGVCKVKAENDLILKEGTINNDVITRENEEYTTVYGMKNDQNENVYNAFSDIGVISITDNSDSDNYGIYTNAVAYNAYTPDASATGTIKIENNKHGIVAGLYGEAGASNATTNSGSAQGTIDIQNKGDDTVYGIQTPLSALSDVKINSITTTNAESGIGGTAEGVITIATEGEGTVYGLYSGLTGANALSENGKASASITIQNTGNNDVYGLYGEYAVQNATAKNTLTSSEENDSHKVVGEIRINNKGNGDIYGLYSNGYAHNAAGYKYASTNGLIDITNKGNGDIFAIFTTDKKATDILDKDVFYFANADSQHLYNAYANTAKVVSTIQIDNEGSGNISLFNDKLTQEGAQDTGDLVFNAYATNNGIAQSIINITNVNTGDEKGTITLSQETLNLAYAEKGGQVVNNIEITNTGLNDISLSQSDAKITANTESNVENTITIKNTGDGAINLPISITASDNSSVKNELDIANRGNGTITVGLSATTSANNKALENAIKIDNIGDGAITLTKNIDNNSIKTSTTVDIKNIGNGDIAVNGDNDANSSIKIVNEGDGYVRGSSLKNYGTIDITNKASTSNNAHSNLSVATGQNYGSINIINNGAGKITGATYNAQEVSMTNNSSGVVEAVAAVNTGKITITNNGAGSAWGSKSNDGIISLFNKTDGSVYGSVFNNGTISLTNEGSGSAWAIYSENDSTFNHGTLSLTNSGSGTIYGTYINNSLTGGTQEGTIRLTNEGTGSAYGVYNTSVDGMAYNVGSDDKKESTLTKSAVMTIQNSGSGDVYAVKGSNAYNVYSRYWKASGTIQVHNLSNGNAYGIYGEKETMNAGASNVHGSSGTINMLNSSGGTAYALYNASNTGTVSNKTAIEYNSAGLVTSHKSYIEMANTNSGSVVGMYSNGGTATNSGSIHISNLGSGTAIGIYADKNTTVRNKGTITIDRADYTFDSTTYKATKPVDGTAIGIYAKSGSKISNDGGKIVINGAENAYGIYAEDDTVTVSSRGTITIDGNSKSENAIKLNGGTLFQDGTLKAKSMNLDDMQGTVIASKNSYFDIENNLSGHLNISSDLVTNGFNNMYVKENMINAKDTSALNLTSKSALFDAKLADNGSDMIMSKKAFDSVVNNSSLASFLEQNYTQKNNEKFFNALKEIDSVSKLNNSLSDLTGQGVLSRFNFEDMTLMRELNYDMNSRIFQNKKPNFSFTGNVNTNSFKGDNGSNTRYLLNYKRNGNFSLGLGVAFTDVQSKDNHDDNTRQETMYQMIMPMGYKAHNISFVTSAKLGYARGYYERTGFNGSTYDGTLEKRVFGLMNEARYPIQFGAWSLEPSAEFNVLGYRQKGWEDKKDYSLRIKSQNTYSMESGIGLYLTQDRELKKGEHLKVSMGIAGYHEFADPYKLELGMEGMQGSFAIRDDKRSLNRAVTRFGVDYDKEAFSIYGYLNSFIDKEIRSTAKTGVKVNF